MNGLSIFWVAIIPRLGKANKFHEYIMNCCDAATRWIELVALSHLWAPAIADAITTKIIARYRAKTLVYDQQSSFMSTLVQSVLKFFPVNSRIAIVGSHSATALAERWVRTLEK
jgi:hypothetical protein